MDSQRRRAGFTMVELLVVMAIIGLLIGMLSFGIQAAVNKTKKTEALVVVKSIVGAVQGYMDEYPEEDWPSGMAQLSSEQSGGYVTTNLFNMLSGQKVDGLNRRRVPFLQMGREMRLGRDAELKVYGLLDPWKRVYRLSIDLSDDGVVSVEEGGTLVEVAGHRVVAWSSGRDQQDSDEKTRRDNVRSWR